LQGWAELVMALEYALSILAYNAWHIARKGKIKHMIKVWEKEKTIFDKALFLRSEKENQNCWRRNSDIFPV
jgi:hypothetical protein